VQLGTLRVAFRSNENEFAELRYFPPSAHLPPGTPVHYTVNCCNLNLDGPWLMDAIQAAQDKSYRGKRFAAGYYLTDHFGPPAHLVTQGTQIWLFARDFRPIIWPFVVKYLLTLHSIDQQMLHLKAAAIRLGNAATVLVGRGGSGKTVLLTQLCRSAAANFLANTHLLISDRTVIPVASTVRVRNDGIFGRIIRDRNLPPAVKKGEFLADPVTDLGWQSGTACPIRNICLLDYRAPDRRAIRELDRSVLLDYMENFSLALNIYGLREDVLDYLDGNVLSFSMQWTHMRDRLRRLVDECRCYYISCDATNANNLNVIRKLLDS
jgi:hypothetical protein